MGDLGLAFLLQASDQAPRYDGALDVGLVAARSGLHPDLPGLRGPDAWAGGSDFVDLAGRRGVRDARGLHREAQAAPVAALESGHPFLVD